jgi:prophage regulatory protein
MSSEIIQTTEQLLPLKDVVARSGLSSSSIYRMISEGKFPPPIHLDVGIRTRPPSRWVSSEVDEWVASQIAARRKPQTGGAEVQV